MPDSHAMAAYFIDRVLPSLISGSLLLVLGWAVQRALKRHIDETTRQQTTTLAEHLTEVTDAQTAELRASRARPARKKPASPGDGSGKAGSRSG